MEQATEILLKPLTPSPKTLQKALKQAASRAQKMADAFGQRVPVARRPTASRSKVHLAEHGPA